MRGWRWMALRRPVTRDGAVRLVLYLGVYAFTAGVGGVVVAVTAGNQLAHPTGLTVVDSITAALGATLLLLTRRTPDLLTAWLAPLLHALSVAGPLIISLAQYTVGPRWQVSFVVYVPVVIVAAYLFRRATAVVVNILIAAEFGLVLLVQGGYLVPMAELGYLVGILVAIGSIFGSLIGHAMDESERLSRLRRFLAPQVAQALLDAPTGAQLLPHRRQISVLFCDLRGFTAFSMRAQPEEVIELLADYYRVVGEVLDSAQATIGGFAGDGVMAYFNDPLPCSEPARTVVQVALDIRDRLGELQFSWDRRGFEVGFGLGAAYGYATLGTIGAGSRSDYVAVGPVVNLASRLCAAAMPGEVLVDQQVQASLTLGALDGDGRQLTLKGYAEPVPAFQVRSLLHGREPEGSL